MMVSIRRKALWPIWSLHLRGDVSYGAIELTVVGPAKYSWQVTLSLGPVLETLRLCFIFHKNWF